MQLHATYNTVCSLRGQAAISPLPPRCPHVTCLHSCCNASRGGSRLGSTVLAGAAAGKALCCWHAARRILMVARGGMAPLAGCVARASCACTGCLPRRRRCVRKREQPAQAAGWQLLLRLSCNSPGPMAFLFVLFFLPTLLKPAFPPSSLPPLSKHTAHSAPRVTAMQASAGLVSHAYAWRP